MDYLGKDIPKLGFGLMRLPEKDGAIDIEQTKQMVDMFLNKGFLYFDTAYGYNNGESEKAAKTCLIDRYERNKFYFATKLPAWAGPKTADEAKQMFYTSLERTGAGYFDFYLLHNLGGIRTAFFEKYGIWKFLEERKNEGLIKHLGFSFHDKADVLDNVLNKHPDIDFVQLQINYADWESPDIESKKCYETARKHKKPIVIMEPVKGGNLANPPGKIKEIFAAANPKISPSAWAVRFAASLDGVITVLSGMSNTEQMKDNLETMKNFKPLTAEELKIIEEARKELKKIPSIPCTACKYCIKGCPKNIAINGIFQAFNIVKLYNNRPLAARSYEWNTSGKGSASECIGCGKCEKVCPQHIDIRAHLKDAAEYFGR